MKKNLALLLSTILINLSLSALTLEGYIVSAPDQVQLTFSEAVNSSNVIITDEDGVEHSSSLSADRTLLTVVYDTPIPLGKYHSLTITSLRSASKNTVFNGGISFYMPKSNDVVINEIMHDVNPVVSLPAAKYIELYNQSVFPLSLESWLVTTGDYSYSLPSVTLPSHAYCLVCARKDSALLAPYAHVVPIKTLDHLLVSGTNVVLSHTSGNVIDHVRYSSSLHSSQFKQQGGWSLERIDPTNPTTEGNWSSSCDPRGGTPGAINSIYAANPDSIAPRIEALAISAPDTIHLYFNKEMSAADATDVGNYHLQHHTVSSASLLSPDNNHAIITLREPLSLEEPDSLFVHPLHDVSNLLLAPRSFYVDLPEPVEEYNDVVINELLFHPLDGGVDFLEIYNPTSHTWDLSSLFLSTRKNGELQKRLPLSTIPIILPPATYCTITSSPTVVASQYSTPLNAYFVAATLPSLPNAEGNIVLLTPSAAVIDEFSYTEQMHHPLVRTPQGVSLERVNPSLPTNDGDNWQSAASEVGYATPSAQNSQYYNPTAVSSATLFSLSSANFSPDNDGYQDLLAINYSLPSDGYTLSALVYTASGTLVARLCNNSLLAPSGTLFWNGTSASGALCNVGVYVIYLDYIHPSGRHGRERLVCSLTSR